MWSRRWPSSMRPSRLWRRAQALSTVSPRPLDEAGGPAVNVEYGDADQACRAPYWPSLLSRRWGLWRIRHRAQRPRRPELTSYPSGARREPQSSPGSSRGAQRDAAQDPGGDRGRETLRPRPPPARDQFSPSILTRARAPVRAASTSRGFRSRWPPPFPAGRAQRHQGRSLSAGLGRAAPPAHGPPPDGTGEDELG